MGHWQDETKTWHLEVLSSVGGVEVVVVGIAPFSPRIGDLELVTSDFEECLRNPETKNG